MELPQTALGNIWTFLSPHIPAYILGILTTIGTLFTFYGRGIIEDSRTERQRKRNERIVLGDKIISRCSVIEITKVNIDSSLPGKFRILADATKGYDFKLGKLIMLEFNQACEMAKIFEEIQHRKQNSPSYQELSKSFTKAVLKLDSTRELVILRAHNLRGTKSIISIYWFSMLTDVSWVLAWLGNKINELKTLSNKL